jgi:FkbM family methyltransferase
MNDSPPTPAGVRLVEGRHGRFYIFAADMYVGRSLEAYGEWTEDEVALLCQALQPGDHVADVGANIGTHTVPLARRVEASGSVLAFEPQPKVFELLAANVAMNGLRNVRLHNIACAAAPGSLRLPDIDYGQLGNFGGIDLKEMHGLAARTGRATDVPLVRLDDVCESDRLRLLKIDVEGMETEVLRGAQRTIARCRPLLYVENEHPESSPLLLRALLDFGYIPYWHVVPFYNPRNFRGASEDIFDSMACVNNLGIPREAYVELHGLAAVTDLNDHPRLHARHPGK